MKVGPSSDNDYLSIPCIAQVRCQLPLSWSVPAHIEEDLDDDEYYNNSTKTVKNVGRMRHNGYALRFGFKTLFKKRYIC